MSSYTAPLNFLNDTLNDKVRKELLIGKNKKKRYILCFVKNKKWFSIDTLLRIVTSQWLFPVQEWYWIGFISRKSIVNSYYVTTFTIDFPEQVDLNWKKNHIIITISVVKCWSASYLSCKSESRTLLWAVTSHLWELLSWSL